MVTTLYTPAATTGARDSLSRDAKKDMRKGIRLMLLIAFKALLDVSLRRTVSFFHQIHGTKTHDRHQRVVITLSANSYISFCAFSGAVLGFSRY